MNSLAGIGSWSACKHYNKDLSKNRKASQPWLPSQESYPFLAPSVFSHISEFLPWIKMNSRDVSTVILSFYPPVDLHWFFEISITQWSWAVVQREKKNMAYDLHPVLIPYSVSQKSKKLKCFNEGFLSNCDFRVFPLCGQSRFQGFDL